MSRDHASFARAARASKLRVIVVTLRSASGDGHVSRGGVQSTDERREAIDRFQAGEAPVLVGSITAAGVGITLTAASNLVLVLAALVCEELGMDCPRTLAA